MATTTATITLSSADLLSDNLSLSATMNLIQAQHNSNWIRSNELPLDSIIPTGTNF